MLKRLFIGLALLALLALPAAVLADDGVEASIQVERQNITVGDVVPLAITVTHPQGWRLLAPKLDKQWGDLEVRSTGAPEIATLPDGRQTTTERIEVSYFRPGTVSTPELTLDLADGQGQLHHVSLQPATIQVKSVLQPNDTELRDIKPQAELWQLTGSPIPLAASLVLAAIVLGGAVVWAWKHRPTPDRRTPRQRALDDLSAIEAQNLFEQGEIKAYCMQVAETLRRYLAVGCGINAQDLTTGELAHALKAKQAPAPIAQQIVSVLRECDAVKFADDASNLSTIKSLGAMTRQIVTEYPAAPTPMPASKKRYRFA